MYENSRTKDTKIYPKYKKGLRDLFVSTYQEYGKKNNPKGDKLIHMNDLFEKFGDSFLPGFEIGRSEGAALFEKVLNNVGIKFTNEQKERIQDEFEKMYNEAS